MTRRGLMHLHSWRSFDSLLPPRMILADARRRGLDFLCVTDHNTIAGSVEVAAAAAAAGGAIEVVIGAEYATEVGDVIGLFLREDIRERRWDDVVAGIRAQGGLVVLPHPHRNHQIEDRHWADVDLAEAFNARSSAASNRRSAEDAAERGLPVVAGADAHTVWELVRGGSEIRLQAPAGTDLRTALLTAPRVLGDRRSSPLLTVYSQTVKRIRRRLGSPGVR